MKIAHINGTYGVGSTGRLIADLVQWGKRQGDESRVFYSERGITAPEAEQYIRAWQRKLHALESRVSGLQGYWSKLATLRLIKQLKTFSPDLVHLHVVHGNCLHLPTLFNYLHSVQLPVVITLHDCWWFTGRCVHPSAYGCTKFTSNCEDCPASHDINPSWFFDRAHKMLTDKRRWLLEGGPLAVVAVSDWVARQVKQSFVPQKCVTRIYNWTDIDMFKPLNSDSLRKRLSLMDRRVLLAVAASWDLRKGLNDLLAVAAKLPKDYSIVLVGNLDKADDLPANILHVPHIDSQELLVQFYSLAEVFINPSRMETFGLTTIEAMVCGTPVVVYDLTASPELIGPGTGLTVPFSQGSEGLLRAILKLKKNKETSTACRNWACERFSPTAGCAQYHDLYRKLA